MLAAVWLLLYFYTASAQTPQRWRLTRVQLWIFSGIVAKTQTTPMDDSVFDYSPEKLDLVFSSKSAFGKTDFEGQAHECG